MESGLDVYSTFTYMSRSITARQLSHSATSELEAHVQFRKIQISLTSWHKGAQDNVPDDSSPNANSKARLIRSWITWELIPCPDVAVEHTLWRKTCFVYPQTIM